LQDYAEQAVSEQMAYLQKIFDDHWKGKDLWKGITNEQLMINYPGKYTRELSDEAARPMSVFTWDGPVEKDYNTLDSLRHYLGFLQAGFLAMEVATGEIRAWVGGINNKHYKYDHVLSRRQAGSVFKPLIYLAALEQGISPCEYFPNDSVVYYDYDSWTPRNADRTYGGYYSLAGALVNSVNTVSAALIFETGVDSVISLARKAGIKSELPAVPSLALGTGNVSLLEMTGVYQAIANGGVYKSPVYITKIEDKDGNVLLEVIPTARGGDVICTDENAELMTEILRGVVSRGTGTSLNSGYSLNADIAGKTGTTQNYSDGWFIGFTPSLVAGAWVGGDLQNLRFREMRYGQGAFTALPVWAKFMQKSFSDDSWKYLQHEQFNISENTISRLECEDFVENKPFQINLLKGIREIPFLRRLFRKRGR
jgi:penicillin-binding protein 1A